METNSMDINNKKDYSRSLRYSLYDGITATVAGGIVSNYITPFALMLKANNIHIGLLNSLPSFLGLFTQFKSPDLLETINSRTKTISRAVYVEATMYMLLVLVPFLMKGYAAIYTFIGIFALSVAAERLISPMWASLMSDTVNKEEYGRYFAWRNRIFSFMLLASTFSVGIVLDCFKNNTIYGFVLLFAVAGVCRCFSAYFLSKMTDIKIKIEKEDRFTYKDFIMALPKSNFAKFAMYISALLFAESIAAAFFVVYMLNELKFSYTTYMIINTAGIIAGIVTLPFWGHYADRIGNIKVIKTTSLFIPFLSVLWIFSKSPVFLILVSMFSSYIWTGFYISEFNFKFDACSQAKRTRCIAYSEITKNVALSIGMFLGGYLATNLPGIVRGSKLLTLFVLSGILKFVVVVFFSGSFREVRETEEINDKNFVLTILGTSVIMNFIYLVVGKKRDKTTRD